MKRLFTLFFIFSFSFLKGQNDNFIGFETGLTNDLLRMHDSGEYLSNAPLFNVQVGVLFNQYLNKDFSLETGFYTKKYNKGFGIKKANGISTFTSNAIHSFQIPLKVNYRIGIKENKNNLIISMGYRFCINTDYTSYGYSSGGFTTNTGDSLEFTGNSYYNLTHYFSLIELGFKFEFKLGRGILFTISNNYLIGLKEVLRQEINYTINNTQGFSAIFKSQGSFVGINVGLAIPIIRNEK